MASDVTENQLSEVLILLQKLVTKAGDHDRRFDVVDEGVEILKAKFRIIDGKISDIAVKVMEIDKRLGVIEAQLSLIDTRLTSLETEARQIRLEMDELNESSGTGVEIRQRIDEIQVRVFQLEEKLAK